MINENQAFRLFAKINHKNKNNNGNSRRPRFNTPLRVTSLLKLPNVSPKTSKNRYNNLNMSTPFEESFISPIIELKQNNIPHVIFMKQYLNLKKGNSHQVSLKKIKNYNILPTYKPNNIKLKRTELNLSYLIDKSASTPQSNSLNKIEKRTKVCDSTKINTSTLNISDNNPKWIINKYGIRSKEGETCNGIAKVNQDSSLALISNYKEKGVNKQLSIFGVFDGHGENGHNVSQTVKKAIESYFTKEVLLRYKNNNNETLYLYLTKNNYQIIYDTFKKASETLKMQPFNCFLSGTTCILVIIVNDTIICANVGDSRAVLYSTHKSPVNLSTDHKPQIKEELERIIKSGGEVSKIFPNDQGPYRVWMKNENFPGLAMSRSIGDFLAEKVGVISTPEIKEKALSTVDRHFLVLGSDGLWEWLSVDEINQIVFPCYNENNVLKAVRLLTDNARKQWTRMSNIIDDITVIVIFFEKQ